MFKRRQINADPGGRIARFLLGIADIARWPLERVWWALERRLVWPLRERAAGWAPQGRASGAGALAAIAVACLVGAFWLTRGEAPREEVAEPARVAIAPPSSPPADRSQEPQLQGAPPTFDVAPGVRVASPEGGDADEGSAPRAATDEEAEAQPGADTPEVAATSSSAKPVPAGPAAMKVARRFAEAFVYYEVGERPARAKTVFGETATPQLAEALAERPPRQPQSGEVPQARVVNLVAGPRAGRAYTVSVSLLRVGLTSELRLEMQKLSGDWVITDVRG
jgi:hypothetical protein